MEAVDDERLMAAIGRIAVRAAELGEHLDLILKRLRPSEPISKWHEMMLGRKLREVIAASAESKLHGNPGLQARIVQYCEAWRTMLVPDRNSAVHSTYILDEEGVIKWDNRDGPEVVTPDGLNAMAAKLHGAAINALSLSMDIKDYLASGIVYGLNG
jgi:hypothetical protein